MAERDTAERQLSRLLHILPAAAPERGASLSSLATALGVDEARVLADLQVLTDRSFSQPAGDPDDFQVLVEADRVSIWTTGAFRRPVRLTPLEGLCVALGLRAAMAGGATEPLRERLESELALAPDDAFGRQLAASDLEPDPEGIRATVAEALRSGSPCRFGYLKAQAEAPEVRRLEPWGLIHAEGHWYAVGRDPEIDERRAFRLDRVLGIELQEGNYRVPDNAELESFVDGGRVFFGGDGGTNRETRVWYSPTIARWIRERWTGEDGDDGCYRVRHSVGDPGWVVRHVLRYGSDAVVEEPDELRAVVRDTAERMARGH